MSRQKLRNVSTAQSKTNSFSRSNDGRGKIDFLCLGLAIGALVLSLVFIGDYAGWSLFLLILLAFSAAWQGVEVRPLKIAGISVILAYIVVAVCTTYIFPI